MPETKKKPFKEQLTEIAKILEWFDAQEELDVEEALKKVEQAADLIKASKKRLAEIENTFTEVKAKINDAKPDGEKLL